MSQKKPTKMGSKTTAMEAAGNVDLSGKVVVITGANTGIGKETARVLAIRGAKMYMLCRNMEKAEQAKQDILKSIKESTEQKDYDENNLNIIGLDLSSLASVRQCAETFSLLDEKIDFLILNAGIMALPDFTPSADGLEKQFAVNHLGHFYLATLLTPILLKSAPARVIVVSSYAHNFAPKFKKNKQDNWITDGIQRKDGPAKKGYGGSEAYGISKTCNVMFAQEFNKRYEAQKVIAVALHPGVIPTELSRNNSMSAFVYAVGKRFMKNIPQGAATTVRCVSLSDQEIEGGHYYSNCLEANASLRKDLRPSKKADENEMRFLWQAKLWEYSELLLTEKGFKLGLDGAAKNGADEQKGQEEPQPAAAQEDAGQAKEEENAASEPQKEKQMNFMNIEEEAVPEEQTGPFY